MQVRRLHECRAITTGFEAARKRFGQSARFAIQAPSITVTSPAGGETWRARTVRVLRWRSTGLPVTARLNIQLSTNGGASWTTIFTNTLNAGVQVWTVPAKPTAQARIRVVHAQNGTIFGDSNLFTIR
jgi:hypothetical protein